MSDIVLHYYAFEEEQPVKEQVYLVWRPGLDVTKAWWDGVAETFVHPESGAVMDNVVYWAPTPNIMTLEFNYGKEF